MRREWRQCWSVKRRSVITGNKQGSDVRDGASPLTHRLEKGLEGSIKVWYV